MLIILNFNFYKTVFQTEFEGLIHRLGEVPPQAGGPTLVEEDKNLVMHITLPITGDYYASCTDKFGVQWMFNCASKI